jgi:hypothetical protein
MIISPDSICYTRSKYPNSDCENGSKLFHKELLQHKLRRASGVHLTVQITGGKSRATKERRFLPSECICLVGREVEFMCI